MLKRIGESERLISDVIEIAKTKQKKWKAFLLQLEIGILTWDRRPLRWPNFGLFIYLSFTDLTSSYKIENWDWRTIYRYNYLYSDYADDTTFS